MAEGLLDLIQSRLPSIPNANKINRTNKYQWIKIYDMKEELKCNWHNLNLITNGACGLEVVGSKLNVRSERKIDRGHAVVLALKVIKRFIKYVLVPSCRIWKAKFVCTRKRKEKCAIKIQSAYRRYIAIKQRLQIRKLAETNSRAPHRQ